VKTGLGPPFPVGATPFNTPQPSTTVTPKGLEGVKATCLGFSPVPLPPASFPPPSSPKLSLGSKKDFANPQIDHRFFSASFYSFFFLLKVRPRLTAPFTEGELFFLKEFLPPSVYLLHWRGEWKSLSCVSDLWFFSELIPPCD